MTPIQTVLLKELIIKLKLLNELLIAFVISLISGLEFFLHYPIQTVLLKELIIKLKLLNELLIAFVISLISGLEFFLHYQIPISQ